MYFLLLGLGSLFIVIMLLLAIRIGVLVSELRKQDFYKKEVIRLREKMKAQTLGVDSNQQDPNPLNNPLILKLTLGFLERVNDLKHCRLVNRLWYDHATELLPQRTGFFSFPTLKKAFEYRRLVAVSFIQALPYRKFLVKDQVSPEMLLQIKAIACSITCLDIISTVGEDDSQRPDFLNWGNILSLILPMRNLHSLKLTDLWFSKKHEATVNSEESLSPIRSLQKLTIIWQNSDYSPFPAVEFHEGFRTNINKIFSVAPYLTSIFIDDIGYVMPNIFPMFLSAICQLACLETLDITPMDESCLDKLLTPTTAFRLKNLTLYVLNATGILLVRFLERHAPTLESFHLTTECKERPRVCFPVFPRLRHLRYDQLYHREGHPPCPMLRRPHGDEFPALEILEMNDEGLRFYLESELPLPNVVDFKLLSCDFDLHLTEISKLLYLLPKLRIVHLQYPSIAVLKSYVKTGENFLEELKLDVVEDEEGFTGIPESNWMVVAERFQFETETIESKNALYVLQESSAQWGISFRNLKSLKKLTIGSCDSSVSDAVGWLTLLPVPALESLTIKNSKLSDACIARLRKHHKMVIVN